jgi:hypothetical protein
MKKSKGKKKQVVAPLVVALDVEEFIPKSREDEWNFTILSEFEKGYPSKTDVSCWWDCHKFDTCPLGIPWKVSKTDEKTTFMVLGCFCSMECVYAYSSNDYRFKNVPRSDVIYMYKVITGKKYNELEMLKKAPNREILEMFGGKMKIEQFRQAFKFDVQVMMAPVYPRYIACETVGKERELKIRLEKDKATATTSTVTSRSSSLGAKSTSSLSQMISMI